jgi:poly(3-hydroxybutyrate) depolymerase
MKGFIMKLAFRLRLALFASAVLLAGTAFARGTPALPSYQVDASKTSVSGLSSGAFMAAQFQVAYSSTLVGAGIIAGGPFYCAGSSPVTPFVVNATTICMNPLPGFAPDAAALLTQAQTFSQFGDIDSLDNLKSTKLYLFSGKADTTVTTAVVDQTVAFYKLAGVPEQNIRYISNVDAGHSIITNSDKNTACQTTAAPYINDCHFMQAQDILRHIYGELNPPATELSGQIIKFNQEQFVHSFLSSMSDDAYLYVPKSCETETCKVHIAFHGCEQGATKIGNLFYSTTGYNELADTNNIIVLYPQAESSFGFFSPYNPKGCWDFWGYSSLNQFRPNFYTKQAPQMSAVKAMLDQLAKPRKTPSI